MSRLRQVPIDVSCELSIGLHIVLSSNSKLSNQLTATGAPQAEGRIWKGSDFILPFAIDYNVKTFFFSPI